MYAVIKVGGKQERVAPGDIIEVEFMKVDPGSSVEFEPILIVDDDGKAHHGKGLSKARVTATLLGDKKGDKVRVFKYRPKSGYRRTQGHRQLMTLLEVDEVRLSPQVKATAPEEKEEAVPGAKKAPAKKPAAAKKTAAKKTAARKPAAARKSPAKKTTAKRSTSRKKST
ncbi:MAG TPA: 50S ribosomal protein L21 [Actinomycetota bacterium]|jgi:large subunit ribosomal protein L21|nr:50S ribosomal protein L21 [Actinomycetota bacterium]